MIFNFYMYINVISPIRELILLKRPLRIFNYMYIKIFRNFKSIILYAQCFNLRTKVVIPYIEQHLYFYTSPLKHTQNLIERCNEAFPYVYYADIT